jgi:hypothetical protein
VSISGVVLSIASSSSSSFPALELVCPAGSLPALKSAVDHGADCVYLGFRDATNARNFAGLNFDDKAIAEGVRYAHAKGRWWRSTRTRKPVRGRYGAKRLIAPPPWVRMR